MIPSGDPQTSYNYFNYIDYKYYSQQLLYPVTHIHIAEGESRKQE